MSQLFGTREDNKIAIRVDNITANNVFQKNLLTNLYERVGGGSGGDLPYYLKSNSIDIDSGTNGSELSANALTLGDETGNETLNKDKIKILSQLKTNIVDVDISNYQSPFPVAYNKLSSNFERLSRLNIGTNDQYCSVSQTQLIAASGTNAVQITPTGINIKSTTIGEHFLTATAFKGLKQIVDNIITPELSATNFKYIVIYNKNTNNFERANNISFNTSATKYSNMNDDIIRMQDGANSIAYNASQMGFNTSAGTATLSYNNIKTLMNLDTIAFNGAPGTGETMVIYNNVTKKYSYTYFPGGGGASFAYLLTNSIEMTANQYVKSSQGSSNISFINGNIVANTSNKATATIDYNKLKNIPKRISYVLNTTADWTYAAYSDVLGGSVTTAIKIPNFDLDCIGDNVYIQMSAYNSIIIEDGKGFLFTCPYLERVPNNRVKFEVKHINDSGSEALIDQIFPVIVTNSGRTKKCFFFTAKLSGGNFGGTIRIKLLENMVAVYDDVTTASSFPSAVV